MVMWWVEMDTVAAWWEDMDRRGRLVGGHGRRGAVVGKNVVVATSSMGTTWHLV